MAKTRNLILVLGDQLNRDSTVFDGFEADRDCVWMAENDQEATHVWCHKYRLVAFFSPMRHFRDQLIQDGIQVRYHELTADRRRGRGSSFVSVLTSTLDDLSVDKIIVVEPGDVRVRDSITRVAEEYELPLEIRDDRHFYCSHQQFDQWADNRKSMVLEQFYRMMRKEHDVLVNDEGKPEGGEWNYDKQNRGTFGRPGTRHDSRGPEIQARSRDTRRDRDGSETVRGSPGKRGRFRFTGDSRSSARVPG